MSFPGRAPTFAEITEFLQIDGWVKGVTTSHTFWSKTLPNGEHLETHVSLAADKSPGLGRFSSILRFQLKINKAEFWTALQTGKPVPRPSAEMPEAVVAHEFWVIDGLKRQVGLSEEEIAEFSVEEAKDRLLSFWSSSGQS